MKILLILAIAMAGGLALSRLMKLLNLPNVTGYLIDRSLCAETCHKR